RRGPAVGASIQVPEHRRAQRRGAEQIPEPAESMAADHLSVVGGLEPGALTLAGIHVEMVAPELDHHLAELPSRSRGPEQRRRRKLAQQDLRLPFVELAQRLADGLETAEGALELRILPARRFELLIDPPVDRGLGLPPQH